PRHRAERAEVEDGVDAADGVVDALVGAELALDDLDVEPAQVRAAAGREVVEHANGVAALEQRAHEVRADEAGAAGDEDEPAHRRSGDEALVTAQAATPTASQVTPSIGRPASSPTALQTAAAATSAPPAVAATTETSGGPRSASRATSRSGVRKSATRRSAPTTPRSESDWTHAFWTP